MTDEDLHILNTTNWQKSVEVIKSYWNEAYGTCELCKEKDGTETLEVTTGGWSENEELIDQILNTMFSNFWWQESKRGGYYKFVYKEDTK